MARRKKYKPKHAIVKKYIPKEFWELADAMYDNIGDVIKKTPLDQLIGLSLGFNAGIRIYGYEDPQNLLKLAATGLLAVKGLESDSEAVGIASLGTLSFLGIVLFTDVAQIRRTADPLTEEYQNPDTTDERKREIINQLQALLWKYP